MKFIYKILFTLMLFALCIASCEEASDAETSGDTTNVDINIEVEIVPGPDEVNIPPRLFFFAALDANNTNGSFVGPPNLPELVAEETNALGIELRRISPAFISNLNRDLERDLSGLPPDELVEPNLFLLYRDLTPNVERRIWDFFEGEGGFFEPRNADDDGEFVFDFFDEDFNPIPVDSLPSYQEPVILLRPKATVARNQDDEVFFSGRLGVFFENGDGFVERAFFVSFN